MVVDIGGGTSDISILQVNRGELTVLATKGDMHLGGQDFTNEMFEEFIRYQKQ